MKREIREFQLIVVQYRKETVQKSVRQNVGVLPI